MRPLNRLTLMALLTMGAATPALAADAGKGETIAVRWCAACHVVAPGQKQAKADAPPFTAIAAKRTYEDLRVFLANPYPRMPDMSLTRDEIADGEVLTMVTRLNGEELQRTTTDLLIFSIPEIIEYLSKFCTLLPGDVIVTGTPGGVGFKRTPPIFMKPGDVCEIEVSKVGILSNFVKDA